MTDNLLFALLALLALGAFHGINPGMGWLFAVARGLQERRRTAVWHALLPLALGHALAVAALVLLAGLAGLLLPLVYLKWIVAAILLALGLFHLVRHRHPRFGGMQVGFRDLTIWSFLMASAHGAGLMVLPFLFGSASTAGSAASPASASMHASHDAMAHHVAAPVATSGHEGHADHMASLLAGLPTEPLVGLLGTLVHTIGYLLVIGIIAVVVYEKLGLRLLRTAWINLDLIWAGSLVATAILTVLL